MHDELLNSPAASAHRRQTEQHEKLDTLDPDVRIFRDSDGNETRTGRCSSGHVHAIYRNRCSQNIQHIHRFHGRRTGQLIRRETAFPQLFHAQIQQTTRALHI